MEKEMATLSSILAWRIPWTEKPGGLQPMGLQRVEHGWATNTATTTMLYVTSVTYFFVAESLYFLKPFTYFSFPRPSATSLFSVLMSFVVASAALLHL